MSDEIDLSLHSCMRERSARKSRASVLGSSGEYSGEEPCPGRSYAMRVRLGRDAIRLAKTVWSFDSPCIKRMGGASLCPLAVSTKSEMEFPEGSCTRPIAVGLRAIPWHTHSDVSYASLPVAIFDDVLQATAVV